MRGGAEGKRVEPVMSRTRIDDGGGSKSDLGEGKDDDGGSRSRRHARTGEA